MTAPPTRPALAEALRAAGAAHHEYETTALHGVRHQAWAIFYAAFVLGRLGVFMAPSRLVTLLDAVEAPSHWADAAAGAVLAALEVDADRDDRTRP